MMYFRVNNHGIFDAECVPNMRYNRGEVCPVDQYACFFLCAHARAGPPIFAGKLIARNRTRGRLKSVIISKEKRKPASLLITLPSVATPAFIDEEELLPLATVAKCFPSLIQACERGNFFGDQGGRSGPLLSRLSTLWQNG